jgi:hypothetical protein
MRRCAVVLLSLFLAIPLAAQPASAYPACVTANVSGDRLDDLGGGGGTDQCLPVYNGSVFCEWQRDNVGTQVVVYWQVCFPVVP